MKVVILHDWLVGFRGAERMLETWCEMFPDAPIYTLIHQKGSVPASIESHKIHTSFLNKIPGIHKHYRKFLPLFPLAASSLKIEDDVDLVLSASHCVIKGVKKPVGAKHISWIHSPMRYLYDQYDSYFGPDAPFYQRWGMKLFRNYLTNWDKRSNKNFDLCFGNSKFITERIKKYYELDCEHLYPYVDLDDFRGKQEVPKEDFYLMVGAFAPNKRVDLAIEAFNELGLPLKIIGGGQKEDDLKRIAGKNIEFLGIRSREEIVDHYQRAKGFIFPGVEDFGITPLESVASGTPVVCRRIGGVKETMTDKTAVFFENDTKEELIEAVKKLEAKDFSREDLLNRAEDFSIEHFKKD